MFLLRAYESRYGQLFEDRRKVDLVGRHKYPETIKGAHELLVLASRQCGGSILREGRRKFINERGNGGRTIVMFTQTIGDRGEYESTPGINSPQGDPMTGKY